MIEYRSMVKFGIVKMKNKYVGNNKYGKFAFFYFLV